MVLGIGIDIIEIDRIRESVEKYGEKFLQKIYTTNELDYCLKKQNKFQHLAARFAAKEAVFKAMESSWKKGMSWKDIEISNKPSGMPIVKLNGKLKTFLASDKSLKISMSHSDNYVTCIALISTINS
ncbi:MAG TPA: holo-ACP synthase [Ignavibacteriaceae bacterium]|nr:holo-ACP synthase [Ignavibacteriaceae bacterium]